MVAHHVADVSVVLAVMVRRRTFFQWDPSVVFLTLTVWLFVAPSNKVKVEPDIMMATLVDRVKAPDFTRNGESTMKSYFPVPIGFRRLKEPTNFTPIASDPSGSPQWSGSRRHRQSEVGDGLFHGTDIVPVAAQLRSPAT